MAEVKFKIDDNWDGIVIHNTVTYKSGDIFIADESLGENRPWLIKVSKNTSISNKAKNEVKIEDNGPEEMKKKAEVDAIKEIVDKKKIAKDKSKAKSVKKDEAEEDVK